MASQDVLDQLLSRLWTDYCARVSYARRYGELVTAQGGRVANDHIAYRTFNAPTGAQPAGIPSISRVIEPLGYAAAGSYEFTDKHLTARHYQHPDPLMPKIFVSQLEVDRLPTSSADAIRSSVSDAVDRVGAEGMKMLASVASLSTADQAALVDRLFAFFRQRPWSPPARQTVIDINRDSQYAAWTLLHGNNVNHFTAYINEQRVAAWPDIEATVRGLIDAGVPMKAEIEGAPGSKLRQTATQAVDEACEVREPDGSTGKLTWSYAYYELAERGDVSGPDGKPARFQGFLGPQATHLFEMTKR